MTTIVYLSGEHKYMVCSDGVRRTCTVHTLKNAASGVRYQRTDFPAEHVSALGPYAYHREYVRDPETRALTLMNGSEALKRQIDAAIAKARDAAVEAALDTCVDAAIDQAVKAQQRTATEEEEE